MGKNKIHVKGFVLSAVLLTLIILSSTTAFGSVIRVPGDYSTIQAGIDAASNGDTVTVTDGTYVGLGNKDLDFNGKAITVKSDNGPENCVIDCEGNGRGFYFHSGETQSSIVSGFTITNGQANLGGGISCSSSPTIINCRIISNTAESAGGGIFCDFRCTITNCIIAGNTAVWGGGICINSAPVPAKITNCTITGNTANHGSVMDINDSYATITNCILWGGKVRIALGEFNRLPQFNYCDIEDDEVTGATIIHLPPLFVDVSDTSPIKWDLHLLSSSPCIDAGTNDALELPDTDFEGDPRIIDGDNDGDAVVDMGADEYVVSASPTATTGSATSVTSSSATLNGTVNPNGTSTAVVFEYGTDTSYGLTTPETSAGSGSDYVAVSAAISGLTSNTTYHFRVKGGNSGGTSYGDDKSFTTLSADIVFVEPGGVCGGKKPCFATIEEGLASAGNGATINIAKGTYDEEIILDEPKELFLLGGWDAAFTSQTSYTTANALIIRQGKIIPYNLILRPLIEASSGEPGT